MVSKLYVGNLASGMTDSALQNLFSPHGSVLSAQVLMNRETGLSRGFGFVEMGSGEQAQAALKAMHGQEVDGRALIVKAARARADRGGSKVATPAPVPLVAVRGSAPF